MIQGYSGVTGAREAGNAIPLWDNGAFAGTAQALCNAEAIAAAEDILAGRAQRVLICGSEGVGKTHLLNTLLGELWRSGTGKTVRLYRAEQWLLQRQPVDHVNVLLVDDLQTILGDSAAVRALTEAVRSVVARGGQVVVAALSLPTHAQCDLLEIGGRHWRRVFLRRPGQDDRLALLRQMARLSGLDIDDVILGLIAERVSGALRGLRGALNRLVALQAAGDQTLTPARAVGALGPLETSGAHAELPEVVWTVVARRFHWSGDAARNVCAYLLCRYAGVTECVASDWLGIGRSATHSGVVAVAARMSESESFAGEILSLGKELDTELLCGHVRRAANPSLGFPVTSGAIGRKG